MRLKAAATSQRPRKELEQTQHAVKSVPVPFVGEYVASSPCLFIQWYLIQLKDKFTFSLWTLYKIILLSDFHLSVLPFPCFFFDSSSIIPRHYAPLLVFGLPLLILPRTVSYVWAPIQVSHAASVQCKHTHTHLSRYSDLLRAGRSCDQILLGARFSAPVQTVPGAHPTSCTTGTGSCQRVQRPGCGVDHPHLSRAEVKEGVYTPTPLLSHHGLAKV